VCWGRAEREGGREREEDSRAGVCEGADGECVYAFMRSHV
jgi:hypothetical protein